MRTTAKMLSIAFVLCVAVPLLANAVSFSPVPGESEERAAKGIRGQGETVCLFQSGTEEIRKAFAIGDVLSVYRQEKSGAVREVGKIRVLSYGREDYLKGKVVEGEVMTGDVAKKGDIAGLIISPEDKCNEPSR